MKNVNLDFYEFRLNLHLSKNYVSDFLGRTKATINLWEREQRAPICAIRALEYTAMGRSFHGIRGWEGWRIDGAGLISPRGHYYALSDIEPPFFIVGTKKPANVIDAGLLEQFGVVQQAISY